MLLRFHGARVGLFRGKGQRAGSGLDKISQNPHFLPGFRSSVGRLSSFEEEGTDGVGSGREVPFEVI